MLKRTNKYYNHDFTPKTFYRGVFLSILKSTKSTIFRLLTVNHAQDLMPIKYKSLFKYKLHPSTHPGGQVDSEIKDMG